MNALFSPRTQLVIGWVVFIGSIIGWPTTAMTVFADEPQGILGLSWGAVVLAGWSILVSCQINKDVETGCPHTCRDCAPPAAGAAS